MPSRDSLSYADLELTLRRQDGDTRTYVITTRYQLAASAVDSDPLAGAPLFVTLDPSVLQADIHDPRSYGQHLAEMLFADLRLREALARTRAQAEALAVPLRLRLVLDVADPEVNSLRWELLTDPARTDGTFLAHDEQVLLSRAPASAELAPIYLPPRADLTALVVIANPTNLAEYTPGGRPLAPIDVAGELARAQAALAPIQPVVLAREITGQPATLANLTAALHNDPDIVYLVCHGTLVRDEPRLWLERDDSTVQVTHGLDFLAGLRQLARRPRLIVFASCQSAGTSHDAGVLAALGPQLAASGIPVVIAMQGDVSMTMVAAAMPVFFRELLRDGLVERALATARRAVADHSDWWIPVLYSRLRDGRIWTLPTQFLDAVLQPTSLPYRTTVRRMVEDYSAVFGGRTAELATLDDWLTSEQHPYALLLAPTGRGKTALLIHWVARVQAQGRWAVVFAPISIRYGTASADYTLVALAQALAELHDEHTQLQSYNQTPEHLRPLIAEYLRRPLPDGRPILLVLDGLDEAVGWSIARDLFPGNPNPQLHILASARQIAHTTPDDWLAQLGWSPGATRDLALTGLNRAAVSDILYRLDDPLEQVATDVDLVTEIARVSEGDPLTLRFLIEGVRDGSLAPGKLTRLPRGLEAYLRDWLTDLRQQSQRAQEVYALLSLLAVALGPLTAEDVELLLPEPFPTRLDLVDAAAAVARFVLGDGSSTSGYVFSHPRLRELFAERLLKPAERTALHQRFVTYGQEWYTRARADTRLPGNNWSFPIYIHQYWIMHLAETQSWDLARQVLTEIIVVGDHTQQLWAEARLKEEGSYAGYLSDLDRLWQHAEATNDIALGVRCALITTSIRSRSGNLSPALLVGLVTVGTTMGKWSLAAALDSIRQMPDPQQQAEALGLLAAVLPSSLVPDLVEAARAINDGITRAKVLKQLALVSPTDERQVVYADVLDAIRIIDTDYDAIRASMLGQLIPMLPSSLFSAALEIARAIAGDEKWTTVFKQIVPLLSIGQQPAVYTVALEIARAITGNYERANALMQLALVLPTDEQQTVYAEALDAIRVINNDDTRFYTLEKLLPVLPSSLLPAALEVAHAIGNDYKRIDAFRLLAPMLPPRLLSTVLEPVLAINNDWVLVYTLEKLAPMLPSDLLSTALEAACAIADDNERADALEKLAPLLPLNVLPAALETARAIAGGRKRAIVLKQLALVLPPEEQPAVYADALEAARAINDDLEQALVLEELVPVFPSSLLSDALETARAIDTARWRAGALNELALVLPPEEQPAVYAETLEATCAIADDEERANVLNWLVPVLPSSVLPDVLKAVDAIGTARWRANVLRKLAPVLPTEEQSAVYAAALEAVRAIADDKERADALKELVPLLPHSSVPTALDVIRTLTDNYARFSVLEELAPTLPPEEQPAVYASALEALRAVTDGRWQVAVLKGLAPMLPANKQLAVSVTALEAVRAYTGGDIQWLAAELREIAPVLPLEEQLAVYTAALEAARDIAENEERADALKKLAPVLPSSLLPAALEAVRTISGNHRRAAALAEFASVLPPEEQPAVYTAALEAARAIGNTQGQAYALTKLIPLLPPEEQPAVYTAALESVHTITNDQHQALVLRRLVPILPQDLVSIALEIARTITDNRERATVLKQIALVLPIDERPAIYAAAIEAARAITDDYSRASILTRLASVLPIDEQLVVYTNAVKATRSISSYRELIFALEALAPVLPSSLLPVALEVARTIPGQFQVDALTKLVPVLPPEEQQAVCAAALEVTRAINNDGDRADALMKLVPVLPSSLLSAALEAARAIPRDQYGSSALAKLVSLLPPEDQLAVCAAKLEAARTVTENVLRTDWLMEFLPVLPSVLLPVAQEIAHAITDDFSRADVLMEFVPLLPPEEQRAVRAAALEVTRAITSDYQQAKALTKLTFIVPPDEQPAMCATALEAVRIITDVGQRVDMLEQLAPCLSLHWSASTDTKRTYWSDTLRVLVANGRLDVLIDLGVLTPWLATLTGPEALAEIAQSIIDVTRCWP